MCVCFLSVPFVCVCVCVLRVHVPESVNMDVCRGKDFLPLSVIMMMISEQGDVKSIKIIPPHTHAHPHTPNHTTNTHTHLISTLSHSSFSFTPDPSL